MDQIRHIARALKPAGTFLVVISLIVVGPGLAGAFGKNPTLSFMLLGAFIIHMGARPRKEERLATLGLAAAFQTAYSTLATGSTPYFGSVLINFGGFLGVASLLVMFVRAWLCQDPSRQERWNVFLTASALPYTWVIVAMCLGSIAKTPRSNDALLCAFDASLGLLPSFSLGALIAGNPVLLGLTKTVYNALPLGAAFVLAGWRRSSSRPVRVIPLYISMMILGSFLYWLYPAAGPAYAFAGRFPGLPPQKLEILARPLAPFVAPRNAMPSLHFGAMLVLMWNSRAWRWPGRLAALGLSLGVAFATMALGEHYLVDLVVAFPFVASVQAAWTIAVPIASPRRYLPLAWGVLCTAAWLLALSFQVPAFVASSALAWSAVLATIAVSLALEWQLSRVARKASGLRQEPSEDAISVAA